MDRFAAQRNKLRTEISEFSDREPKRCKAVGITLRYPTYSDLTPDQLEYYIYWKSTVGTEDFKKAPEGYVWLFVSELISSDDIQYASERLNAIACSTANDGSPLYPGLLSDALIFAELNKTPQPEYAEWMASSGCDPVLSCILASPVSDVPLDALLRKSGIAGDRNLCSPGRLGSILRRYEKALIADGYPALRDMCMIPVKTAAVPFSEYAAAAPCRPVESIEWKISDNGPLGRILTCICDLLTGKDSEADVPCKGKLKLIIRDSKDEPDRSSPFSKSGGLSYRFLGTPCTRFGPSCLNDPSVPDRSGKHITLGDILTFGPMVPKSPARFIPSGFEHPAYSDLSKDRFTYFLYWKDSFRHGRYLDTDNGYVNLFLTEIINSQDTGTAAETLRELYRVYGDPSNLIGITMMDHALCRGEPFPDYRIYTDKLVVNHWVDGFLKGDRRIPMDERMLNILRSGSVNVRFIGKPVPLEPFCSSLRRIFSCIDSKKGIGSVLSAAPATAARSVYVGLEYLRSRKEIAVRYYNYLGCRKFIGFIDKAADYASALAEDPDGERRPFTFGGVNCAEIFREEFLVWRMKATRPAEKEFILDPEAVTSAESDLREVTEMMRTEEVPEQKDEGQVRETAMDGGDPWSLFFASLSEQEREYLRIMTEGPPGVTAFLRGAGISMVKMEDSINSKALDTVGDTVAENGTAVEDYLEDLKKGLR